MAADELVEQWEELDRNDNAADADSGLCKQLAHFCVVAKVDWENAVLLLCKQREVLLNAKCYPEEAGKDKQSDDPPSVPRPDTPAERYCHDKR